MKNSAISERFTGLFIFEFIIIMLICILALAKDGGSGAGVPYPQNAAVCRIQDKAPIPCAYKMAAEDFYDNDLVSNQLEVYTCDMAQASCGPYAGNPDCVQVILTTYKETSFTKLVGIRRRERFQALALAQQPDQVRLLHLGSGPGPSCEFSVPSWTQIILGPYRLVFLVLIGVLILGLPQLLRRTRGKPL